MKYAIITIVALAALLYFGGCSYRNVDNIKANATAVWQANGFEVVGYEGYQLGYPTCPGGRVWYVVKRPNSETVYHGFIAKWGSEYHVYNLKAINAIKGD